MTAPIQHVEVAVVGAGISGIAAAIRLREAGLDGEGDGTRSAHERVAPLLGG